jgi:hypothetical protein
MSNVIKIYVRNLQMFIISFVPVKLYQSSLMFASKATAYHRGAYFRYSALR